MLIPGRANTDSHVRKIWLRLILLSRRWQINISTMSCQNIIIGRILFMFFSYGRGFSFFIFHFHFDFHFPIFFSLRDFGIFYANFSEAVEGVAPWTEQLRPWAPAVKSIKVLHGQQSECRVITGLLAMVATTLPSSTFFFFAPCPEPEGARFFFFFVYFRLGLRGKCFHFLWIPIFWLACRSIRIRIWLEDNGLGEWVRSGRRSVVNQGGRIFPYRWTTAG